MSKFDDVFSLSAGQAPVKRADVFSFVQVMIHLRGKSFAAANCQGEIFKPASRVPPAAPFSGAHFGFTFV